ncbi:MAG TPA: SUMF1/EgtB/PvdO family nonheme iron enzyme [Pirellulales bacterium]|nr:SUMF1/EgtB/PvdO family nonheme iron enzyme [Pirellulales bacterium]
MHRAWAIFLCCLGCASWGVAADEPPENLKNSLGIALVRLAAGEFMMGDPHGPPRSRDEWELRNFDESPAHRVTIRHAFYLGVNEITNAEFENFAPGHRTRNGRAREEGSDQLPVTNVTWQEAVDFCAWLSEQEGRPYRLPTEAEWEYACRPVELKTVDLTKLEAITREGNFGLSKSGGKQSGPLRVGSYDTDARGLNDMHGNVAEWCADWYGPYAAEPQTDPVGRADGYARVVRGGSFLTAADKQELRKQYPATYRAGLLPDDANLATGFRIVLGAAPTTKPLPVVLSSYQKEVRQEPAKAVREASTQPFFKNFTREKKNPTIPDETWGPIFSKWNHFTACCACPNGDILAVWYTTVSESGRELAQAASRLRAGAEQWDEASLFFDVPGVNDHAPVLLCSGKRIFHFCTQSLRSWDDATDIVRWSDDNGVTWSQPRIMVGRDDPQAMSQPCCALRTKRGELVVACDGDGHRDERLVISRDDGRTWRVAKGDMRLAVHGQYAIHPTLFERNDGQLGAFLRGPNPLPMLVTADLGETWTAGKTPFSGITTGQKAAALKLRSGALLLCSFDRGKQLFGSTTFAALSLDEGATWAHVRPLPDVSGYLSVTQAADGVIYVFGSRQTCVAFNEPWIKEGPAADK